MVGHECMLGKSSIAGPDTHTPQAAQLYHEGMGIQPAWKALEAAYSAAWRPKKSRQWNYVKLVVDLVDEVAARRGLGWAAAAEFIDERLKNEVFPDGRKPCKRLKVASVMRGEYQERVRTLLELL